MDGRRSNFFSRVEPLVYYFARIDSFKRSASTIVKVKVFEGFVVYFSLKSDRLKSFRRAKVENIFGIVDFVGIEPQCFLTRNVLKSRYVIMAIPIAYETKAAFFFLYETRQMLFFLYEAKLIFRIFASCISLVDFKYIRRIVDSFNIVRLTLTLFRVEIFSLGKRLPTWNRVSL